jgi:hypothetical protein
MESMESEESELKHGEREAVKKRAEEKHFCKQIDSMASLSIHEH